MCLTCGYNDCVCHYELQKKSTDIPRSSLPPLPAGWSGPWEAYPDGNVWGMRQGRLSDFAIDCGFKNAEFLAALLNVTHPAPAKEGV